ncbi:MAG: glycosyltransferase family 39 protein [Dehalococcoidia bacterium]
MTDAQRPFMERIKTGWSPRRLGELPTAVKVSIALAIAVNLLFAFAYLWSRGGQETKVRVEVRGDEVTAWLDGKQIISETLGSMAGRGGVMIRVDPTTFIPSFPTPRGLDSLRVTDLESGEVLLEDDFSSLDPQLIQRGGAAVEDGHVGSRDLMVIGPFGAGWRDVRVEAEFDNIVGGGVMVRSDGQLNGASFNFRPYRHLDSSLQLLKDGAVVEGAAGPRLEASQGEVMRSLVAMTVRGYPMVLLAFAGLVVVVGAVLFVEVPFDMTSQRQRLRDRWRAFDRWLPLAPWIFVSLIALGAVIVTAYINTVYNDRLPHVPDEVSYIFQARTLASGRLSVPPPPVEESFNFFHPPLIAVSDGKWASIYPLGHPLVLAIGVKLGILWLMPPLVGGATLLLLFGAAKQIYNVRVGLIAVLFLAASPFFLMTASNYMSHNTAVLYVVASLFCIAHRDRHPLAMPVLAGIFFGLLLNTRPLTATALVVPFGLMLLAWLIPPDNRIAALKSIGFFVLGGAAMLLAYGLYNLGTTGDLFLAGYSTGADLNEVVGFGGAHSVGLGLQNEQTQMATLLLVFNGWPQVLGIIIVATPFIFGTRDRWDWILLACAIAVMGVYTLYEAPGLMHGPRYWYEAMPFLVLLAARGIEVLASAGARAAAGILASITGGSRRADWAGYAVVYPLVAALSLVAANDWLRGDGLDFAVDAVPRSANELQGFNGVNNNMVSAIDERDLSNALVLVETCPNWQCIGSVFWRNAPTLDGDIVYAKDLPHRNGQLFDLYPDRLVYQALYGAGEVSVYGGLPEGDSPDAEPPRAGDIPTATPEPTATPDPDIAQRNDTRRIADLERVRQGLEEYQGAHGGYPLAEGVQTLCAYPFDSACLLEEFIDLPRDPNPQGTYWYQSDGVTFVVYTSLEMPGDGSQCPDPVPPHLAQIPNLYCVRGGDAPLAEQ